jgi:hypothetical protein
LYKSLNGLNQSVWVQRECKMILGVDKCSQSEQLQSIFTALKDHQTYWEKNLTLHQDQGRKRSARTVRHTVLKHSHNL